MINEPQQNPGAEQAVLGGFISDGLNKDSVLTAYEMLEEDSFYSIANKDTFKAIKQLYDNRKAIDLVSVTAMIPGIKSYLAELYRNNNTATNISFWALALLEKSKERAMMDVFRMAYNVMDNNNSHQAKLDATEELLKSLADNDNTSSMQSLNDILVDHLAVLDKRFNSDIPTGLQTGYTDIDHIVGGLRPGNLITLGARTSIGKSALGFNIAENISKDNTNTLYITMEMTKGELAERSICSMGRVDNGKIRDMNGLNQDDWSSIHRGAHQASELNINIVEMTRPSINQVKAFARAVKRRGKLDFLVIDHLHLMNHMNQQNMVNGIANTTSELKALAMELQVPILLMAQLNRGNAKENRYPEITDLKGGGSIEEDSDGVYLIHRNDDDPELKGKALVLIKKNRGGEKDVIVVLAQNLHNYRFDNFSYQEARY